MRIVREPSEIILPKLLASGWDKMTEATRHLNWRSPALGLQCGIMNLLLGLSRNQDNRTILKFVMKLSALLLSNRRVTDINRVCSQ